MFRKTDKIKKNIIISGNKKDIITLSLGRIKKDYIITSLECCDQRLEAKLNSMGLYVGCVIKILQNNRKTPLKIAIGSGRIGIDKLIADKITVRRI